MQDFNSGPVAPIHTRLNGHAVGVNRFVSWDQSTLAQYALEATERIRELEADLKAAMDAYRTLLRQRQ